MFNSAIRFQSLALNNSKLKANELRFTASSSLSSEQQKLVNVLGGNLQEVKTVEDIKNLFNKKCDDYTKNTFFKMCGNLNDLDKMKGMLKLFFVVNVAKDLGQKVDKEALGIIDYSTSQNLKDYKDLDDMLAVIQLNILNTSVLFGSPLTAAYNEAALKIQSLLS